MLVRSLSVKMEKISGRTFPSRALKDVKEKVFNEARPEAAKIVIFITNNYHSVCDRQWHCGHPPEPQTTEILATELRENGSLIYAAVGSRDPHLGTNFPDSMNFSVYIPAERIFQIVGNPSQVFLIRSYANMTADVFRRIIAHFTACLFDESCRFDDPNQQTCKLRPLVGDTKCINIPPASFKRQCQAKDCEAACDKNWKWKERMCQDGDEGKNLTVERDGPMPPLPEHKPVYENCPRQKPGPFCPETLWSTASSGAKSPVRSEAITVASTAAETTSPSSDNGFPIWAIALIALVYSAFLLLILVGILLTVRKRKQNAATAAKKALAGKVAMMGEPPTTISSRPLATPSTSLAHGFAPLPAADHSMGVSLALDVKKLGGHSMASKSSGWTRSSKSVIPSINAVSKPVVPGSSASKSSLPSKLARVKPSPASKLVSLAKTGATTRK